MRREHGGIEMRQAQRQFMFVSYNEHRGQRNGRSRALNRHVQRNSRQATVSHRDIPLRYQLRFRASDWDMPYVPSASAEVQRNPAPSSESESSNEGTIGSPPSRSLSRWNDPREAGHVQFYHDVVSGQLGGAVTSAFWEQHVLQRLQQAPVIKQALVALSLAYREICVAGQLHPPCSALTPTRASQATGNAISGLRSYLQIEQQPPLDVVLTCAVLLFALEKTRGDRETSLFHLDNAIAVFKSWTERLKRKTPPPQYKMLRSVILLLDGNACIEDEARAPLVEVEFSGPFIDAHELRFNNIQDMRDDFKIRVCHPLTRLLVRCHDGAVTALQDCPHDVLQEKVRLQNELVRWRAAVDYFVWDRSSIRQPRCEPIWSKSEEISILTVEMHYLVVKCSLSDVVVAYPDHANAWNQHSCEILAKGERVLELLQRRHGPFQLQPDGRQRAMIITYAQSLPLFAQRTTLLDARSRAMRLYADLEPYTRVVAICPGLRATERFREDHTGVPRFSSTAALLLTLGSRS